MLRRALFWLLRIPANLLIGCVRFYQLAISPMMRPSCRFTPTCSAYFIEAVKKYGAIRGGFKGCIRILKCNPFHKGGVDYP